MKKFPDSSSLGSLLLQEQLTGPAAQELPLGTLDSEHPYTCSRLGLGPPAPPEGFPMPRVPANDMPLTSMPATSTAIP